MVKNRVLFCNNSLGGSVSRYFVPFYDLPIDHNSMTLVESWKNLNDTTAFSVSRVLESKEISSSSNELLLNNSLLQLIYFLDI